MNADQKRRMKKGLSDRMKREAEYRRCPACNRGNALSAIHWFEGTHTGVRVCRYCGHERRVG